MPCWVSRERYTAQAVDVYGGEGDTPESPTQGDIFREINLLPFSLKRTEAGVSYGTSVQQQRCVCMNWASSHVRTPMARILPGLSCFCHGVLFLLVPIDTDRPGDGSVGEILLTI